MILVMIKLQRAPWWKIRREEKKKSNMNISFCGKKGFYFRHHMLPLLWVSFFNEHLSKKRKIITTFDELHKKKNPIYSKTIRRKLKTKNQNWYVRKFLDIDGHGLPYGEKWAKPILLCKFILPQLCCVLLIVAWVVAHQHFTMLLIENCFCKRAFNLNFSFRI